MNKWTKWVGSGISMAIGFAIGYGLSQLVIRFPDQTLGSALTYWTMGFFVALFYRYALVQQPMPAWAWNRVWLAWPLALWYVFGRKR